MWQTLLAWDYKLLYQINEVWSNRFFDFIMPFLREKYFWAPLYLFAVSFIWLNYPRRRYIFIVGMLLCLVLADQTASHLIKPMIGRLRPCNNPDIAPFLHLLVPCGVGKSFVSSHATNHFAIAAFWAICFGKKYPWLWGAGLLWAAIVSYGQVYVGVHFPSDVIGGAVLGVLLGSSVAYLTQYILEQRFGNETA